MCFSERVANGLVGYFVGVQVKFPFKGHASVRVAHGRELPLVQRTGRVQVMVMTPWAPVVMDLALSVSQEMMMC